MPISVQPGRVERDSRTAEPVATKELRLAVVCYGGVSLAIYMHGVTLELQSLFRASQAYAEDSRTNPFGPKETERAYWEALKEAEQRRRCPIRVSIDIIAGTSAGGINGVVLAKALSMGASQDALRDVWLNTGSILKLLSPISGAESGVLGKLKSVVATPVTFWRGPFNGDYLLHHVYTALKAMKPKDSGAAADKPSPWPVELHVTLTDVRGFQEAAPAWDPSVIRELRHQYRLVFRSKDPRSGSQFDPAHDRALAFAARATSSFPGAFPATRIADLDKLDGPWDGRADFLRQYWAPYRLSDEKAEASEFMDGGVLDNAPFGLAIEAIERLPATSEVDRRLLYIQPDPMESKRDPSPRRALAVGAAWRGLSTIPRKEPVLADMLEVRKRNDRVERAKAVIAAAQDGVSGWGDPPASPSELAAMDEELHERLGDDVAAAYAYRQLKVFTVVDRLAEIACQLLDYPPETRHALFVRDVLVAWAGETGLLDSRNWESEQLPFLKAFDLSYRERRIRLVIDRINDAYDHVDLELRSRLDAVKERLYHRIWVLTSIAEKARKQAEPLVRLLFDEDVVRTKLAVDARPADVVLAFARQRRGDLDTLRTELGHLLGEPLKHATAETYEGLLEDTAGWPEELRRDVLRRYAMFPRYDALLFPLRALSDLGELDRIEVVRLSPLDARLIKPPGAKHDVPAVSDKLEGDAVGHFAAFLRRRKRENDYLWGRLDAVERLVAMIVGEAPSVAYKQGFKAVLGKEGEGLRKVTELVRQIEAQVDELDDRVAVKRPDAGAQV